MIKVYVSRFNSETDSEPHLECYEIEKTPQMKVLDALQAINEKLAANEGKELELDGTSYEKGATWYATQKKDNAGKVTAEAGWNANK